MALDKLVDSTKLDACLDAEADAIRAKTGGSSDIPFDYANNKGFADAIASIQTGGGGYLEQGTIAFHTGEVLKELTIPISSSVEQLDNYIFAVRPIKTWAFVEDEWVERDSLDFTGIDGFKTGTWNPLLSFLIGTKKTVFSGDVYRQYSGRGNYSGGGNGNACGNNQTFSYDSTQNCLLFTGNQALNGAAVCVADGGLTFEYTFWGWANE